MAFPSITSILSSPLSDLVASVGNVIDKLTTTDEEKLEAQRKLVEIERNFQLEMAKLDGEWAKTQADVITSEAKSESYLARNWRPILMLVFTYIVGHNYVIAPIFHLASVPIPPDMWELLRLGMGGYIMGRSVEKIAPVVADIVTNKK